MAIATGLENKPWWYGAIAGGLLAAALFGVLYWRINIPQKKEIEAREVKLAELQGRIQEGRAAKQKLPQFREEVRGLELELDQLLRILPARRNTPDLLRRIRALTEQGDFALLSFTPGAFADKDFYSEWPISIVVEGTYHNLALFFDRISRFSRIINIENLNINTLGGRGRANHTIAASFFAKTFIYKEPPPEQPPAAPAAGAAGGGG